MLAVCACGEQASSTNKQALVFPPAEVATKELKKQAYAEKFEYVGSMKSRKSISLFPHVDGHITRIDVRAGENVKAGQKIMQIDSRLQSANTSSFEAATETVKADLASAEKSLAALESSLKSKIANVEFTNAQYHRYQTLAGQGAVALSELDSWKNNYLAAQSDRDAVIQQIEGQKMIVAKYERSLKQSQANLQAQKEQLRYYEIRAPFSGTIGDVPVKLGDHVDSERALCTLTENHPLEVYVSVPAEKAAEFKQGMNIELLASDGKSFGKSQVTFVAPLVDPSSQTVLVKAVYKNEKNYLRAEQTVRAIAAFSAREAVAVPTSAVMQTAGKYFVFLCRKDKEGKTYAQQTEINVYGIEGDSYQAASGLASGDRVVTSGIQRLADGAPISERAAVPKSAVPGAAGSSGTAKSAEH